MTVRVRFAPSPTGKLHVGNVRTALLNMLYARQQNGTFVLRFEDTDEDREVVGAEESMLEVLSWLGLVPDESPFHGGDYGPYRTMERDARGDYKKALQTLFDKGMAYECFVSKEELDMIRRLRTSRGLPPGYDNRHRDLSEAEKAKYRAEGRQPVIRFKLLDGPIVFDDLVRGKVQYLAENLGGDPVIVRSNGVPTFAFGGAVDDINQDITLVIRGEDHVTNTASQVRIFEALDATPPQFAHISLMLDSDGGKLSKRLDSLSIVQLRAQGYLPNAICSYLAAVGTSMDPTPGDLQQLAQKFNFSAMGRAPVRFDLEQVTRLNATLLREMDWAAVKPYLMPFLDGVKANEGDLEAFWLAIRHNVNLLSEVRSQVDLCFGDITPATLAEDDRAFVRTAAETLPKGPYTSTTWNEWVNALKTQTGRKGKALFMPLRLALTGEEHGPELADLLPVLGEQKARDRLAKAAGGN